MRKRFYNPYFTPMQYSPALWLDASDQSTLFRDRTGASASTPVASNADPVGTWKDKSGNAWHYTAPADSNRLTYTTAALNGLPVCTFDGTDDHLICDAMAPLFQGEDTPFTLMAVVKSATSGRTMFGVGWNGGTNPLTVLRPNTTNATQFYRRDTAAAATANITGPATGATNHYVCSWNFTGTSVTMSVNGAAGTPTAADVGTLSTLNRCTLGTLRRTGTDSEYLNGSVAELLLFMRSLSSQEELTANRYLGNKWGISVP